MAHVTVDATVLQNVTTTFRANYLGGLNNAEPYWQLLAAKVTSDSAAEEYPFMGDLPRMREWKNRRQSKGLQANNYRLPNRKFESTVRVPREDIEDDKIGLWSSKFVEMGKQTAYWPDDLVFEALLAGTSTACYDSQFFFDTDHPADPHDDASATQSNLRTSSAFNSTNLNAAIVQMATLVDENGNPLRVRPTHVIAPFALRESVKTVLDAERNANGSTNINNGDLNYILAPQLDADSATTWYLADLSPGAKPLIFQERIAPEFQSKAENSENAFDLDEYEYGNRARGNAGYGMWQLIQRNEA